MNRNNSMSFKDQFSAHADTYAAARPNYPDELFEFLSEQCVGHDLAWDCATGNGQAAVSLAPFFKRVIASDASAAQIQQARSISNVEYQLRLAETAFLEPASCDLVVTAQALHWFDIDAFFRNAENCLKTKGVLAVWCYGLHWINDAVDKVVYRLYEEILSDFWPPERRLVESLYADIQLPFEKKFEQKFPMSQQWTLQQLCGYITSWSALQRYMEKHGDNPLQLIYGDLVAAWGTDLDKKLTVNWPLKVKLAQK